MFDMGFTELLLIAILALVILGPEQMLTLTRHIGFWMRKLRALSAEVRDHVDRELHTQEMQSSIHTLQEQMRTPGKTDFKPKTPPDSRPSENHHS